jgi:hypothetical protein
MSIRVQCEKCGSVLKIKEELAGTQGKCPKCKSPFVVPQIGESDAAMPVAVGEAAVAESASAEPKDKSPQKPSRPSGAADPVKKGDPGLRTNGPPSADGNKSTDHDMPAIPAAPPAPSKPAVAKSGGDEFDPAEFLMAEGGPKPKPAPQVPRPDPPAPGRKPPGGKRLELSEEETEVPGPQETLAPAPRAAGRTSAAEMANAMLTSGAATAASAKDLLAKSAQDSRTRAGQMPEEARQAKTDYFALAREIVRAFGVYILGTVILCGGLYWMMYRMMNSPIPVPPLAPVHGRVTVGGKPLANVHVYFTPIGVRDEETIRPRDSMATTDAEGNYELLYFAEEGIYGAVIGKNRVWLSTDNPADFKNLPPQYLSANTTTQIEDVKETGGEFNIILP